MEHLKEAVLAIKNDEQLIINHDTHKLEQKTRNRYKTLITEALLADINETLNQLDLPNREVILARIEKGIGIGVSTEFGYVPVFIEASMKGLEFDIEAAAVEYREKIETKAAESAERLELKRIKMEQDAIKRERKRLERERLEAEKMERLKQQLKEAGSK